MNVTREVVSDLLPMYFSGDASADTAKLVEEFFRHDPDFERTARHQATPLEILRSAPSAAAESENDKRGLERIRRALHRRTLLFGVSVFLSLAPLSFQFTAGHIAALMVRDAPWEAALYWSLAVFFWFLYVTRLGRRMAARLAVIWFALIPIPFVWHSVSVGQPVGAVPFVVWACAAVVWIGNFWQRQERAAQKE
jgi:hypothetical protein